MLFALSACFAFSTHSSLPNGAPKKPLDHSVYDGWKAIRGAELSPDGNWFFYGVYPQEGDGTLYVVSVANPHKAAFAIERGTAPHLTHDGRFLIVTQVPGFAEAKKARIAKAKPDDQPKSSLVVVDLNLGQKFTKERVTGLKYAEEDQDLLLYKYEALTPKPSVESSAKPGEKKPAAPPSNEESVESDAPENGQAAEMDGQAQRRRGGAGARTGAAAAGEDPTAIKPGDTWILRNLATGKEETLADVSDAVFNKKGTTLAYVVASKDATKDGVFVRDLKSGTSHSLITGEAHYKDLAISEDGKIAAFVSDKGNVKAKPALLTLYSAATSGKDDAEAKVKLGSKGLPADWVPADVGLSFSEDDRRLFFHSALKPEVEKKSDIPDEDKASLDIWNWKDERLQTQQIVDLNADKNRTYLAYVEVRGDKVVQLGSPSLRLASVPDKGKANFVLEATEIPYLRESSWNPGSADLYRIDLGSGMAKKLVAHRKFDLVSSPDGRYSLTFDLASKKLTGWDVTTGKSVALELPKVSFTDELDDHPDVAPMYGFGGFTKDGLVLLYDRFDIWAIDPSGSKPALNLTRGSGRRRHLQLRSLAINSDPETRWIDLSKPILLSVRNEDNESTGVFELSENGLKELVYGEHGYAGVLKAKDAPVLAFTESSFSEYPDYWLTDNKWTSPTRVSEANPQQKEYAWGSVELVSWMGDDGQELKGLLYTPDGLDRLKKYPMITYFYERNSETLYNYIAPVPSASIINIAYFVSNGYCVFVPDINYKSGLPGPSAYSAIVSGVQAMLQKGFIDPKRLGIQGQSWGGYQTAYLVTQTNMFAAAGAGAPVGDMFSAYGGIRYGAGIVRQFQYEHSQSRIGGTPWEKPLLYIENSPVFMADRVKTPLLIMSNDKDGAVPHTQGIEFFVDLRRLNKPSWLLVYNDEDHNLTMRKNRKDLSVRLAQFFDHYLKGAPMPVWMSRGVPALEKGKNYGFDLDK